MTKKIMGRKCATVVVKEVVTYLVIFIFSLVGCEHYFVVVFLISIGTVYALLSILYFFKGVLKLSTL